MKEKKILKNFIFFLCLYYCCFGLFANQYEEMSFSELEKTILNTENHLNLIGRANGAMIIETIIDVSEKFNSQQQYYLKALSYNFLGKTYFTTKDYKEAIKNYKMSLDLWNCSDEFFEGFNNDFQFIEPQGILEKDYQDIKQELREYCDEKKRIK